MRDGPWCCFDVMLGNGWGFCVEEVRCKAACRLEKLQYTKWVHYVLVEALCAVVQTFAISFYQAFQTPEATTSVCSVRRVS